MKKFLEECVIGFVLVFLTVVILSVVVILGACFISMSFSPVVWSYNSFDWVGFRILISLSLFLGTLLAIPR